MDVFDLSRARGVILNWYTKLTTSLIEFYVPPKQAIKEIMNKLPFEVRRASADRFENDINELLDRLIAVVTNFKELNTLKTDKNQSCQSNHNNPTRNSADNYGNTRSHFRDNHQNGSQSKNYQTHNKPSSRLPNFNNRCREKTGNARQVSDTLHDNLVDVERDSLL